MNTTKKITGDVFIIPNDTIVETWCCNNESDNWHCHGLKLGRGATLNVGSFPSDFPARLFEGKKEGDTITLHSTVLNVDFELKLNQLSYRYRQFGPFEEVLAHVSGE